MMTLFNYMVNITILTAGRKNKKWKHKLLNKVIQMIYNLIYRLNFRWQNL